MTGVPLYVPDTHALYWHFEKSVKLSTTARGIFDEAYAGRAVLVVSHIVLAELFYLLQKHKKATAFGSVLSAMEGSPVYRTEGITLDDVRSLDVVSDIPEMHDRLIAIQARRLGATVVTTDPELRASAHVKCVW